MTKKITKRALLASVMSLILCFAMLLGTTYAWFTDSVTSGGNVIKSGNLDIEMSWADGTEDPANVTWEDASTGAIFNYDKWEPGYTEVRHIRIANVGTLALKYIVDIVPTGEVSELADVIDVYYIDPAVQVAGREDLNDNNKLGTLTEVLANLANTGKGNLQAGEEDVITLALKMQETAGNEYMNKSIGSAFAIKVFATQLASENDSFGNDYDANAPLPWDGKTTTEVTAVNGVYEINSAAELAWVAEQVNAGNTFAGKTVKLMQNIDLNDKAWTPIGKNADDNGKVFKGEFDGNGKIISNLYVNTADKAEYRASGLFGALNGTVKNFTVDGAKIVALSAGNSNGATDNGIAVVAGSIYAGGENAGAGTIEKVSVKNATVTGNRYVAAIAGYAYGTVTNCSVDKTVITSTPDMLTGSYDNGDKAGAIVGYLASDSASGNKVSNTTVTGYRDIGGIVGYAAGAVTGNTATNVTVTIDNTHNYKNYDTPAKYDAGEIVGEAASTATVSGNTHSLCNVIVPQVTVEVGTAADLKEMLTTYTASGSGDNVINITKNIDLTGTDWESVVIHGYTGAGVITVNGNGHTITGLNAPLFAGGFAGTSGVIINELTLDKADMTDTSDGKTGFGAFISSIDSMPTITLNKCKLTNSKITSDTGARVGGLIGWTAGYNNQNDGPVTCNVKITNCEVSNCVITAKGSVGAIIGHAGNNPATLHNITGCVVKDNTLTSTHTGEWRVGVVVGTAEVGEVTISGTQASGNTISQTGKTAPEHSDLYGRFVPGTTGKLTIDGAAISNN